MIRGQGVCLLNAPLYSNTRVNRSVEPGAGCLMGTKHLGRYSHQCPPNCFVVYETVSVIGMVFPGVSVLIGMAAEELVSLLSDDEEAARAARSSAVWVSACLALDPIGIGLELLIPEYVNLYGPLQQVGVPAFWGCSRWLSHLCS